jgi:tetratricopeptide (TPR) repeat protein
MAEEGRQGAEDTEESGGEFPAASLDPGAAALAMERAGQDPDLAARAGAYFDRQARLVAIQTEHLHEQREVQLSHLKLKRLSERLRVMSQISLTIAVTLVAAYLLIMLHDAVTSRAVIVDPFDAPPALAGSGLSGKVAAGALLDQLTRMQVATQSSATKRGLANSWSGDIKVEVPETGLSLGDIDRLLKSRFGHDLHVGGDLVQTQSGGLELTVRGDGVLPRTFSGNASDLHKLTTEAGEYVYGQTQPALFAVYLLRNGRNAEVIGFCKEAVLSAAPDERPYILNAWAGALANDGRPLGESLALERAALALKPDYWTAYANAALDARNMGDEEGAWRLGSAMRQAAGGRPGRAPELSYQTWDYLTGDALAARSALEADAEAHAGIGSATGASAPAIAQLDIDLHDLDDARLRLATFDMTDPYTAATAHYVRGKIAEATGDIQTAQRDMEAWGEANRDPAISGGDTSVSCFIAPIEEAAGHPDRADAALTAGGHFVDCYRYRADILDRRGDWPGALGAYAEAVALAPDMPQAWYSWGLALARHGDLPGAVAKLEAANLRGPHWAEPLKAWGDVLARQGHPDAALKKYAEALDRAPAWPELRAARDAALAMR